MSQQPPPAAPVGGNLYQGDIYINGHIEGENFAIGPGAQVNVVKNIYQAKISDTQEQRLVAEVEARVLAQIKLLNQAGFRQEVAPLPGRAEQNSNRDPFALPVGISPLPGRVAPADAAQWQQQIAPLDHSLRQLDQRLSAAANGERRVARELVVGQERVNLVELLIQQGNLAFWSFRQAAARLFADQVSAYYLAYPAWPDIPPIQAFHNAALNHLDVRRAWVLYQKYRLHSPAMTGPYLAQLSQGRWRDVLQAWLAAKQITAEAFQYERAYLKAIGERYDPQAVRAAAQQAEACFAEAVRRQPDNSIALVNWGAIKAETALFFSIENGAIDHARLEGAQALFNHAEGQLAQRRDREGQIALGMCLLHDAMRLPPNANLGAVQWAAQHTEQMRQEWPPAVHPTPAGRDAGAAPHQAAAQQAIQWEMVQRNWARRDGAFFDEQKAWRAREILVAAGAAALLFLLDEKLTAHAQMLQQIGHWSAPVHPTPAGGDAGGTSPHQAAALTRRAFLLRAGIGVGTVAVAGGATAIAVKAGVFSSHRATTPTPTTRPTATFTPTPPPTPGMLITTHRHGERVNSLAWELSGGTVGFKNLARSVPQSGGGSRIASAGLDGTVQVWDARTGKTLINYTGHRGMVLSLAWSPDGRYIASGGQDQSVQVWDPNTGMLLSSYPGHKAEIQTLAWSPDSQRIVSGDTMSIIQVSSLQGDQLLSLPANGLFSIQALAWSPDGQYIVGGGAQELISLAGGGVGGPQAAFQGQTGLAVVWDASQGSSLQTYSGHRAEIFAVAWSPDSTQVASGSADTTAQVWDRASGSTILTYKNHSSTILALAWARNRQLIVSGSRDTTAQVWSASDGSTVFTYSQQDVAVNAVAWSPDEREIASGSNDGVVQVWVAPSP